jgi:hypothetical protein
MRTIFVVFLVLVVSGCGQTNQSDQISESEVDQLIVDSDLMAKPVAVSAIGTLMKMKSKSGMSHEKLLKALNDQAEVFCDQDGCRFQKKGK